MARSIAVFVLFSVARRAAADDNDNDNHDHDDNRFDDDDDHIYLQGRNGESTCAENDDDGSSRWEIRSEKDCKNAWRALKGGNDDDDDITHMTAPSGQNLPPGCIYETQGKKLYWNAPQDDDMSDADRRLYNGTCGNTLEYNTKKYLCICSLRRCQHDNTCGHLSRKQAGVCQDSKEPKDDGEGAEFQCRCIPGWSCMTANGGCTTDFTKCGTSAPTTAAPTAAPTHGHGPHGRHKGNNGPGDACEPDRRFGHSHSDPSLQIGGCASGLKCVASHASRSRFTCQRPSRARGARCGFVGDAVVICDAGLVCRPTVGALNHHRFSQHAPHACARPLLADTDSKVVSPADVLRLLSEPWSGFTIGQAMPDAAAAALGVLLDVDAFSGPGGSVSVRFSFSGAAFRSRKAAAQGTDNRLPRKTPTWGWRLQQTPAPTAHSHSDRSACHAHDGSCHCHYNEEIACDASGDALYREHINEISWNCIAGSRRCVAKCQQPWDVLHYHYETCKLRTPPKVFTRGWQMGCHDADTPCTTAAHDMGHGHGHVEADDDHFHADNFHDDHFGYDDDRVGHNIFDGQHHHDDDDGHGMFGGHGNSGSFGAHGHNHHDDDDGHGMFGGHGNFGSFGAHGGFDLEAAKTAIMDRLAAHLGISPERLSVVESASHRAAKPLHGGWRDPIEITVMINAPEAGKKKAGEHCRFGHNLPNMGDCEDGLECKCVGACLTARPFEAVHTCAKKGQKEGQTCGGSYGDCEDGLGCVGPGGVGTGRKGRPMQYQFQPPQYQPPQYSPVYTAPPARTCVKPYYPPPPVYMPPTVTYKPPPVYQPPAPVYKPPVVTYKPPPVYQPPAPVDTYKPPPVYKPPAPVYQPPAAPVYQPPAPVYQPPAPVYQPPAPEYQPPAPVYQAPAAYAPPVPPPYAPKPCQCYGKASRVAAVSESACKLGCDAAYSKCCRWRPDKYRCQSFMRGSGEGQVCVY